MLCAIDSLFISTALCVSVAERETDKQREAVYVSAFATLINITSECGSQRSNIQPHTFSVFLSQMRPNPSSAEAFPSKEYTFL